MPRKVEALRRAAQGEKFLTVAEVARVTRTSKMTVYRAIADGEFPAVRIRGRWIVPAGAIDEMAKTALKEGQAVDAAAWVRPEMRGAL